MFAFEPHLVLSGLTPGLTVRDHYIKNFLSQDCRIEICRVPCGSVFVNFRFKGRIPTLMDFSILPVYDTDFTCVSVFSHAILLLPPLSLSFGSWSLENPDDDSIQ